MHRLEKVGWQGNPQFDQRVFTELFEASGGIPRRVNQVANRLLLLGAVEERTRIDFAMLKSVLDEMEGEKAFPEAAPKPTPAAEPSFEPVRQTAAIDPDVIDELLAERDVQIAELQQAIIELSNQRDEAVAAAVRPELAAMQDQIATMGAKVLEQERSIRQTLTMLIEWIESEIAHSKAA